MRMRYVFVILMSLLSGLSAAQSRLDYFMTEAAKKRMLGQWSAAHDLYSHCLEIDSCSAEALFHLGRMSFYIREDSIGLDYLYKAVELDSMNPYYIEPLASILIRQSREEDALPLLERLSRLQSGRSDVLYHIAGMYDKFGRTEDAIATLDRLEMLEGKMQQLVGEKFALYMQMGDSAKAFRELQSLCDEYPADMSFKIDMGYRYQQIGDFDRALQIYDEVRKTDPSNIALQMAMLDYYETQGMDSLYVAVRDSILYAPGTDVEKRAVLMQQMIQHSSTDSADIEGVAGRFERILQLDSTSVDMLAMYAAYLNYRRQPQARICDVMSRILHVEPDNDVATRWLLSYYAGTRNWASLEEICRRGVNYHPEELAYSYFLAMILSERGDLREALEVMEKGLRMRSEETRIALISDAFLVKGDVYYKQGKWQKAFEEYDSALVYNKDNVLCLNNYAYYLSLRNENLDKAEEMSYRTIKAEPDNKTYLDTYAWILFMQGKYAEAQEYMDKVVPEDCTEEFLLTDEYTGSAILEHAADIAWFCGDAERAAYLWRLAVRRADTDATPLLQKKARKKKYIK